MQYFINSNGTTTNLITDPIYQGSTNANEMVLVAPFSAGNQVTCDFRLPTGISTEPYAMNIQGRPMNIEGITYNVWRCLLDGAVTEYAGQCQVQFSVYQGNNIKLNTYTSVFTVGVGTTPTLPKTPTQSIYQSILNYLAMLNPQYNIQNVYYSADEEYKINTDDTDVVVNITRIPSSSKLKGDVNFSIANIDGSEEAPFYALGANYQSDTGFIIYFATPQNIGKMQLSLYGAFYLTELAVQIFDASTGEFVDITDFQVLAPSYEGTNVLLNINNSKVSSMRIYQPYTANVALDSDNMSITDKGFTNGRFYVKSIDLWQPSMTGYITIQSSTGRMITYPDVSYDVYLSLVQDEVDLARMYATEAKNAQTGAQTAEQGAENALTEINEKAGKAGGYPVLVDIDGLPKLPTVYIQQVDIKEYIEITSESELETITAQVGDIALLVGTVEGVKTVTKSWILLSDDGTTRDWAVYGSSYATNAGNATFAQTAGNAQKINGLTINGVLSENEYNSLVDKTGVYFVSIT